MKYIPYIIIAILVGVIILTPANKEIVEKKTTDTVAIHVFDTIEQVKPVYKYRETTDTIYIPVKGDTVKLPRESFHYSEDSVYDAWVSGYKPSLDSIRTYSKKEYVTITKENISKVYVNKWNVYVKGGLFSTGEDFIPFVGVSTTSPKRIEFGANIGLFDKSPIYGFHIGIKLNK